jgi:PKD repeat protein
VHELVIFNASSTPDGGTIISYAWNFGDGTPVIVETDPITTHVYASVGNYTVTLNVTDSARASSNLQAEN